jgi:hypothetical protein
VSIFHLSVNVVSRSSKRSAPAAAAYRTGTLIVDQRTGQEFDYTRKGGIEPSPVLLLPSNAPEWASDRAALWNAVEQTETRKNSTVAREYVVALPSELKPAARRQLAVAFAQRVVDQYGCVADVAIHQPSRQGDDRNHHAHILCSTRKLEAGGFTSKTRELDDMKTGAVTRLREVWAGMVNDELERAKVNDRVDHRSHRARGLNILPTVHQGVIATEIARRGEWSEVVAHNEAIRAANPELNADLSEIAAQRKNLENAIAETKGAIAEAAAEQAKAKQREADRVAAEAKQREADRVAAEAAKREADRVAAERAAKVIEPATKTNAALLGIADHIEQKGTAPKALSREEAAAFIDAMFGKTKTGKFYGLGLGDQVLKDYEAGVRSGRGAGRSEGFRGFATIEMTRIEVGFKYVITAITNKTAELVAILRKAAATQLKGDSEILIDRDNRDKARALQPEQPVKARSLKVKQQGQGR